MVSAVCAALLGLVASRLLGPRLIEMAGEAAPLEHREPNPVAPAPSCEFASVVEAEAAKAATVATPPLKRRSPRRARPAVRSAPDAFADDLVRGITKVGERRYEIRRGVLDLALANMGALPRLVRVAPDFRDGRPVGFRLAGIRGDGPFGKLGLRNGDVLISANGLDITTPDRVLDAFGKLKGSSRLVLGLRRGNQEIVQEYVIR
jgi:hypothetical protein